MPISSNSLSPEKCLLFMNQLTKNQQQAVILLLIFSYRLIKSLYHLAVRLLLLKLRYDVCSGITLDIKGVQSLL